MQRDISRYLSFLVYIAIDFVRENGKKIEIFKINRPTDGHYLVMEVLGMPSGKTF